MFFRLGKATSLGEGKLWIKNYSTPLKYWPCVVICPLQRQELKRIIFWIFLKIIIITIMKTSLLQVTRFLSSGRFSCSQTWQLIRQKITKHLIHTYEQWPTCHPTHTSPFFVTIHLLLFCVSRHLPLLCSLYSWDKPALFRFSFFLFFFFFFFFFASAEIDTLICA